MQIKNIKQSLTVKILFTGFLALMLLIPLGMVTGVISEREGRRAAAIKEVSEKWGFEQFLQGPVLVVPYQTRYVDEKKVTRMSIENAYFLPESLKISGRILPEKRSRGLYEVILYSLKDLHFRGEFKKPDFRKLNIAGKNVLWERAFLAVGIPDNRGIQKEIRLKWNGESLIFLPGVKNAQVFTSGIHVQLKNLGRGGATLAYDFRIDLRGSSSLSFAPLGKETIVEMESPWEHPSFFGAYLPATREISGKGFSASWKVSYFGRNIPQEWKEGETPDPQVFARSAFGVKMYLPVDFYQKCVRAVKYGFLFISLTFLAFFLFELFNRLNIHPIQYLMVGFAMCLFYLLFLSLSEHMNFLLSYTLSTLGVIGMISGYCFKVLGTRRHAAFMAGLLVMLYGYLYILLENEDYTLLLGSLALFIILGTVMYITRNIDWYNIRLGNDREGSESLEGFSS